MISVHLEWSLQKSRMSARVDEGRWSLCRRILLAAKCASLIWLERPSELPQRTKKRQTEKEVGGQHQRMDRADLKRLPESAAEDRHAGMEGVMMINE